MLAVVEDGDEVIVFEPFYENYVPDAAMSGARLVFVTLRGENFSFDRRAPPGLLHRHTPNNPSGKVFSRAELEQIAPSARNSTPSASPTKSTSTSLRRPRAHPHRHAAGHVPADHHH
ncbi:aminotransferase class I/II-fold pyridoxal phosphate-dependent enzyme [Tepidiforma thermophila]|uniref:aminotransferase class I/II-fold pyridoxal phosphate-dependent enzyme n=1 Tax=Tepidiforma thermophila (strain KCTC 52669 / CGMCC 1.13589 / G233) TaxID=2761530 RepID=UPI0015F2E984|nr:aminotransferase class I/II-fold pyridoxal phosphate-dependent enzyme [Tepidiforma thermophila]